MESLIDITDVLKGKSIDTFPHKERRENRLIKKAMAEEAILSTIMKEVSDFTKIPEEDIRRKIRKREIAYARHLYSYFCSTMTVIDLQIIADFVYEGYIHSSVIHGRKTIENLLFYNNKVKSDVEQLKQILRNKWKQQ